MSYKGGMLITEYYKEKSSCLRHSLTLPWGIPIHVRTHSASSYDCIIQTASTNQTFLVHFRFFQIFQ